MTAMLEGKAFDVDNGVVYTILQDTLRMVMFSWKDKSHSFMFISSDQSMLFFLSDILMVWLMICHFAVGLVSQKVRGFYRRLPS